jgi:hypothetical protein
MMLGAKRDKGIPQSIVVGYREDKGKTLEVWEGERQTDFVLSGPYGVWVDILLGKLREQSLRHEKTEGSWELP